MYIGIDLGTSSVKLLLTDAEGKILAASSRQYPLSFPQPGWSEQSPSDWYEATVDALKELLSDFPGKEVKGIGIGGQMHGLVLLDNDGNVLRPAILWNDGRTSEETAYLNDATGEEQLLSDTGNIAFPGFTAPKVLWVKKHEPEIFQRISKILLPKDYLVYRLTGEFSTDMSDASGTLLFDVEHGEWSSDMLSICSVTKDMLPSVHKGFEKVGVLKTEIREALGINGEVSVVAGAGDNAAAAVGMGIAGAGQCNISLGTSGTVFITSDAFSCDDTAALHSFRHADGGYHYLGCMLSAASCNKWWMDEIIKTEDYSGEQKGISTLGENNVMFLPYLMGERSPHNDPFVRGGFLGLSLDTKREDMTQAILEGVAFGVKDMLSAAEKSGITLKESMICGGGAKSPLWRRIIANVTGLIIHTAELDEGPAYGGAILAAVGCKAFSSVDEAARAVRSIRETVAPEKALVEKYAEKYRRYRRLYPAVKELYR